MSELVQPPVREQEKPNEKALVLRDGASAQRLGGALIFTGTHVRLLPSRGEAEWKRSVREA
jgi:hypothetical protein